MLPCTSAVTLLAVLLYFFLATRVAVARGRLAVAYLESLVEPPD